MSLSAPWTTRSRIAGIERTRILPPSFAISFFRACMGRYVFVTSSPCICFRKPSTPLSSIASNVTHRRGSRNRWVTFEAIEESGVEGFLKQIQGELVTNTYRPMQARKKEIAKDGGKIRVLSIPAIRDRVVQGALKLILEPIFEADFQSGSYGYRPKRTAHQAVNRVALLT